MFLSLIDTWDLHFRTWAAALGWPGEAVLRLILAAVAGGLVGLEREDRGRQAGFRTNMLVCLGSALVMIVSIQFASHPWGGNQGVNINVDPARIAYGVMTGVGFLGAGTIIHTRGSVRGLTTAAGLWCVAAVGLAAGFGLYLLAILATILILASLWFLDGIETLLPKQRYRTLTVRTAWRPGCIADAVAFFKQSGVRVLDASFSRSGDLSTVLIELQVMMLGKKRYYELDRELSRNPAYELVSMGDT